MSIIKGKQEQLDYPQPTVEIGLLISKLNLSLLLLAPSYIFFQISKKIKPRIFKYTSIFIGITLMFLSCSISLFSIYELREMMPKYNIFCESGNKCIYTIEQLQNVTSFYTIFSIIYVILIILTSFVLLFFYYK